MDHHPAAKPPTVNVAQTLTLASLIARIEADPDISACERREITSGIRTVATVLQKEPHLIPATAPELGPLLRDALPTAVCVSATRWRNAKSLLRRALARVDPLTIPGRSKVELLPAWCSLVQLVEDKLDEPQAKAMKHGLSRFSRYCSSKGVLPSDVTQAVYDAFYDDLVEHSTVRSPREIQQTAGNAWNKAHQAIADWPGDAMTMRDFRLNPSLPWSAFPESFQTDVESYFRERSADEFDLFDEAKPISARTIATKRRQIRLFATVVVQSGRSADTIHSLADLVEVSTALAGLKVLVKRGDQERTHRNQNVAYLLYCVARDWVDADDKVLKKLKNFSLKLAPKTQGMTLKNRTRLQQFDNPRQLEALLMLPEKMMAEANKAKVPTAAEARIAQMAVAIELLLMAPLRIKNISEQEIDNTLLLHGSNSGYILIGAADVKNKTDLEVPLPRPTLELIDTYLKRFHPLIAPSGCRFLFPSRDGGHKRSSALSNQIAQCLRRRCGLAMNAHLFRHLAAKIYLEAFPGAYGVVRMLLGHESIDTTTKAYCGTEYAAAFRAWDAVVTRLRGGPAAGPQTRSSRKRP